MLNRDSEMFGSCYDIMSKYEGCISRYWSHRNTAVCAYKLFVDVNAVAEGEKPSDQLATIICDLIECDTTQASSLLDDIMDLMGTSDTYMNAVSRLYKSFLAFSEALSEVKMAVEEYEVATLTDINKLKGFVDAYPFNLPLEEVSATDWSTLSRHDLIKELLS